MKIAITGASGYIGRRLTDRAIREGHIVYALGRRPLSQHGVIDVAFDLDRIDVVSFPTDLAALIHLAADTSGPTKAGSQVAVAEKLFTALPMEAKILFVSSQSARIDAPSDYGRTKSKIEALVTRHNGVSIRPGLVYGGSERGLFGRLCHTARKTAILPLLVWPRPLVQPIHVDDLNQGILRLIGEEWPSGRVAKLAQPEPIPFDRFLRILVLKHLKTRRLFIPVPAALLHLILVSIKRMTGRDLRADQLASLIETRTMDTAGDLARLRLNLRPLQSGFDRSPPSSRKALVREAWRLFRYLLGKKPKPSLIGRYVRALEVGGDPALIACTRSIFCSNLALAILDRPSRHLSDTNLAQRIDLAVRIAEASPESFERFVGATSNVTFLQAALSTSAALGRELATRGLRVLATPLARHLLYTDVAAR